jgi:FkbM family methyltransferase
MQESLWIERKHYSKWMIAREFRSQLPLSFRLLGLLLNRMPHPLEKLIGRTRLFCCARFVHDAIAGSALWPLRAGGVTLWLDLSDPRCIRVPLDFVRDPPLPKLLSHLLHPGIAFVDVGSNHGTFSAAAALCLGEDDLILAVEPQPRLALATRLALDSLARRHAYVHTCALSDFRGWGTLVVPEHNSGEAALRAVSADSSLCRVMPSVVRTLDDILLPVHGLPTGFVLKIDVEGNETSILRGAAGVLRMYHPVLIIEVNPPALCASGSSVRLLLELLQRDGYTYFSDFRVPTIPLCVDGHRRLPRNLIASKSPLACWREEG